MAHEVKIPAAGESINSATIGQWHKADGETVAQANLGAGVSKNPLIGIHIFLGEKPESVSTPLRNNRYLEAL